MKFRKKPVVIKATQWFKMGDHPKVIPLPRGHESPTRGRIPTLEGPMEVCPGDWIITGVHGEHYPCKPDIFEKTYEQAEQAEQAQPVAWATSLDFNDDDQEIIPAKDKGKLGTSNYDIPFYTAPPKREWVGLTDEEVSEVIDNVLEGGGWLDVARALEAAIKEKNA